MKLKHGVKLRGVRAEVLFALMAAEEAFGDYDLVVTSVCDSRHSPTSLHYSGAAVDLRTRHLPNENVAGQITDNLRSYLGPEFDVVLESDHIHVEWQPKDA